MTPFELLTRTYAPLLSFAEAVTDDEGWTATQLPGWCVRDLLFHLATDAQRGLVALFTPSAEPPDTDEVSYWRAWAPNTAGAQSGLRGTRIIASAWTSVRGPADLFTETARALLHAAGLGSVGNPQKRITTQGHVLTPESLLRTLAVEATVHHLDLAPTLAEPADPTGLIETARVIELLLGAPRPTDWSLPRYIRLGTGRGRPSATERAELGAAAEAIPAFG